MKETRNIIFDIGNVLVRFDPLDYLIRTYGEDFETIKILHLNVFASEEWKLLDQGLLTTEEAVARIEERIPQHTDAVEKIMRTWETFLIEEISTSVCFLKKFKEMGFRIYALSNYPERGFLYTERSFPVFKLFDGKVISYDVREVKPGKRIYEILPEKYQLKAEECIFIDDTLVNIEAAGELGIQGIHYLHSNQLMELYLRLSASRK
ncbi:HAD family phosphatase [Proteiniclasticum sp. SCR006]|uniref:HAD family phosphatase n=1 Tax=Proteiniclasticum aestuarii TaxID=2817862 RepID=A0A939HC24_9CLOT|nr:HAD family phosphatase [Proteiniclasticum aestuarii]MBO1265192.1 HAD family phosphatase [Proteiniclasticum aestuarii]